MIEKKKLLNSIFVSYNLGQKYIIFQHDDKTWIMPEEGKKQALEMYQPSTRNGKVLKKVVLTCSDIPIISKKIGVSSKKIQLNDEIRKYIQKIIGTDKFYVAAYMGDTSSRQNNKVTLQIYNKNEIIAYAKISKDSEVIKTFEHEIEALKYLRQKGISCIPKVIGQDEIQGMKIFIQTTEKPLYQKFRFSFDKRHIIFIDDIVRNTKEERNYEDTDYYHYVQYLKNTIMDFKEEERIVLSKAIKRVEDRLGEGKNKYAFAHGDYTAWNVYFKGEKLDVFDFEYCNYSMPCYIDLFHYITQMCLLGKRNNIKKIILMYEKNKAYFSKYISNVDFVYLCYLVFIVSFYKQRTKEKTQRVDDCFHKWIAVMQYLNQEMK